MRRILGKMFGFIVAQPIHATLRQMRLISVAFVVFCTYLIWDIWQTIKPAVALSPAESWGAISGLLLALLAGNWKAISSFAESHEEDGL